MIIEHQTIAQQAMEITKLNNRVKELEELILATEIALTKSGFIREFENGNLRADQSFSDRLDPLVRRFSK